MKSLIWIAISLSSGCGGGGVLKKTSEADNSAQPAVAAVDPTVAKTSSGQTIQAPPSSAVAGAKVSIPPGSLAIDTTVTIEQAVTVATPALTAQLGIGIPVSSGVSVAIQASSDVEVTTPFTLAIPLPSGTNLLDDPYANLSIIYHTSPRNGASSVGIITRKDISIVDGLASFATTFFGAYQTIITKEPIQTAINVVAAPAQLSKATADSLPKLEVTSRFPFMVAAGGQVELAGKNFRPSMVLALGSSKISDLKVVSDIRATFSAPVGAKLGLTDLYLDQDGASVTVSLVYLGSSDHPFTNKPATEICAGEKFYDGGGVLQTGTRNCSGTAAPAACTEGGTNCLVGDTFKVVPTSSVVPENIKAGITMAGIVGTLTNESHSNCTSDGGVGCVTTATFKAASSSSAVAANIKSGVTIAGVTGSLVSETHSNCISDGAVGCVTTASFKAVNMTAATAANIKSGVTLAGVTGQYPSLTFPLTGADSTADLDVATFDAKIKSSATFEWFDSSGTRYTNTGNTNIAAANITNGVTIFGMTGTLTGAAACTADGQTGCVTTSTFKSANTSAYTAWDIRKGKTVGGVPGNLTFFKNMANTSTFNRTSGSGAAAGVDIYDTIDDFTNGGSFPTQNPSSFDQATGANWIMDPSSDNGSGSGTAANGSVDGTEAAIAKDQVTNLLWATSESQATRSWEQAITACSGKSFGIYTSGWRLPTQKELYQAYVDGIISQSVASIYSFSGTGAYWSATTASRGGSNSGAWVVTLTDGTVATDDKSNSHSVICVK